MTNREALKILYARVECLRCESCIYKNCDECELCDARGTVGEQRQAVQIAIKVLEKAIQTAIKELEKEEVKND